MSQSTHLTTIDIAGFEREINVTFWVNEITEGVAFLEDITLVKTGENMNFLLGDEELVEFLTLQIESECEDERNEAELERSLSYMDEY